MGKLILLRHGQSQWNLENRFTGFVDVPLSEKGKEEALRAGSLLKTISIDAVFTSVLQRAIHTADLALEGKTGYNLERDKALNERHYGDLQGLNKDDIRQKYGEKQVHIWRRSYDVRPPGGESLKDTCLRAIPYYQAHILPLVKAGKNVLVVAHGNSLRGIVKEVEQISDSAITEVEIATGIPLVYEINSDGQVVEKTILS